MLSDKEMVPPSPRLRPTAEEFLARSSSASGQRKDSCGECQDTCVTDSDMDDSQASTVTCVSIESPECMQESGASQQTQGENMTGERTKAREVAPSLRRRPTVAEFLSRQSSTASRHHSNSCGSRQDTSVDDSDMADSQSSACVGVESPERSCGVQQPLRPQTPEGQSGTREVAPALRRRPTIAEFLARKSSTASSSSVTKERHSGPPSEFDECEQGNSMRETNRKRSRSEEETTRPVRRVLKLDDEAVVECHNRKDRTELVEEEGCLSRDDFDFTDDTGSIAEQQSPTETRANLADGKREASTAADDKRVQVDAQVAERVRRLASMMASESSAFEGGEPRRFLSRVVDVLHAAAQPHSRQQRRQPCKDRTWRACELLVSGHPQSGKTLYAAAVGLAAKRLKLCTIVVTKTRGLSNQVARELKERYFASLPEHEQPVCECVRVQKDTAMRLRQRLKHCLVSHGVLVVNYHLSTLCEVAWIVCELRGYGSACDFVLVKDDSDEIPASRETGAGCAMKFLEGTCAHKYGRLGYPPLVVHVTARPLPILLNHTIRIGAGDWFWHSPSEDYSGAESLQPLHGAFLRESELSRANAFWSDKVDALYADAHPPRPEQQQPGVLVLDAVNPFVNTLDCSEQRATRILRAYPRFIVVRTWGLGGIAVKVAEGSWIQGQQLVALVHAVKARRAQGSGASSGLSGGAASLFAACQQAHHTLEASAASMPLISRDLNPKRNAADPSDLTEPVDLQAADTTEAPAREDDTCELTIAEVLECLDDVGSEQPASLRRPVVVLGFSRMLGETFRSSSRVPTHILCMVSPDSSLQAVQSALGRASFYGQRVLHQHGHSRVRVLMPWRDWDAVRAATLLALILNVHSLSHALSLSADDPSLVSDTPIVTDALVLPWKANVSVDKTWRRVGHERSTTLHRTLTFHPVPKDCVGHDLASIEGLVWAQEHDALAQSLCSKQAVRWTQFCAHGRDKYLCDVPDCGWT